MIALWAAILGSSLAGSLHCVAMCGPLVGLHGGARSLRLALIHALGRLTTYGALGALAGLVGSAVDVAGHLAAVQHVAAIVAGGAIVGWGVRAIAVAAGCNPRVADRRADRPLAVRLAVGVRGLGGRHSEPGGRRAGDGGVLARHRAGDDRRARARRRRARCDAAPHAGDLGGHPDRPRARDAGRALGRCRRDGRDGAALPPERAMTAAAVAPAPCRHCSLPVPAGRASAFCCSGCEVVYGAIAANGLERFYALRETAEPARTTDHGYTELDDPAFQRLHVQAGPGGTARAALYLEDLRCTACVWLVESAPRCLAGVSDVRVDLGRSRADVAWDPAVTSLAQIARYLDRIGHPPHPYRGLERDALRRREDRALLVKLGVAGAAAGNLMLLAIALYAGLFGGMSRADTGFFRWASLCVAVPALGFAATPFFRTALGALRARRLHLDLPLSIGILAGLLWGSANVIRGVGEIYFDSLAMLVFLLLTARWIVLRHQRRASTAAELLLSLTPSRAHRLGPERPDGAATDVPIEAIVPGDVVRVLVGEIIPVDGDVVAGRSAIDLGVLTGESRPIDVAPGAHVHAGTVNVAAPIAVCATAVGEVTRVGRLVASIR
ncbi:MAG: hypothetical protein E6J90_12105 [Deltaproteobacteria bacterium]|nr:MAG: hypothetical protein E6J90_12105 [Deltaproteobacteria bacterium]